MALNKENKKEQNNNYIDNVKFREALIEYEELSDDVSVWWKRIDPLKKTFKERKEDVYNRRFEKLQNETPVEREIREKKLYKIKNVLGRFFLLIASRYINKGCFVSYDELRKQDMISDACLFMYSYAERFDTKLKNPLAYFTQVAHSAFLQNINNINKNQDMFTPLSYIDLIGDVEYSINGDWVE